LSYTAIATIHVRGQSSWPIPPIPRIIPKIPRASWQVPNRGSRKL